MQINIHLLGTLVAFAIVLRLFLVIQRLRDQRKYGYENKVVILVLGPLLSGKSAIVEFLKEHLPTRSQPLLSVSWSELKDRVKSSSIPRSPGAKSPGDPLFDMWTIDQQPDGSATVDLTSRGKRCLRAIHRSWNAFLQEGCSLVVEYPTLDEWSIKDLISILKDRGDRVIAVELRPTLSEITYRESRKLSSIDVVKGCAAGSYRLSKNLPSFPKSFRSIIVDIPTGQPLEDVIETTYKAILQTGLL